MAVPYPGARADAAPQLAGLRGRGLACFLLAPPLPRPGGSRGVGTAAMRILVHDYAGHPFQVQLSRAPAARGHALLHLYAASNPTPKGPLAPRADDPTGFTVEGLALARAYRRYAYLERWWHERAYGRLLARRIAAWRPEVVLCCNTPLDALVMAEARTHAEGARFVFWVQDLLGLAALRILRARLPVLGALVGRHHMALERRVARAADELVLITDDFAPLMRDWGIAERRIAVIENWAPLGAFPPAPRDNPWARAQGLAGTVVILYTGMLGLKHDPSLVLALAEAFRDRPEVAVVVVSEGRGADWLAEKKLAKGLENLRLLAFQPFERMAEVMASADVLLAILEPAAGIFSVPSKVLSYLCAKRPILASVPAENLAARILCEHQAGLVVVPGDAPALVEAARRLVDDSALRARLGANARAYAEHAFDIDAIAARFEAVLVRAPAS